MSSLTPAPAGTVITHKYLRLNKEIPVAPLNLSFSDREELDPIPSLLQVNKEKPASSTKNVIRRLLRSRMKPSGPKEEFWPLERG